MLIRASCAEETLTATGSGEASASESSEASEYEKEGGEPFHCAEEEEEVMIHTIRLPRLAPTMAFCVV